MENPIIHQPDRYEDLGPTRHSICSDRQSQRSETPNIPAAIRKLVAELGLRYRPSAQADLEAHAGQLAFLARDLATQPIEPLREAVAEHIRTNRFMPKAAELIETVRRIHQRESAANGDRDSRANAQAIADRYNLRLAETGKPMRWIVDDFNQLTLAPA